MAAVAAGIAPLAIAQDGGGSIRRPASHTGVVGLEALAVGLAAPADALPGLLLDFEVIGPVARTVADARALLFDALRGPDAGDRSSLAAAQAAAARPHLAGGLRVRYVERLHGNGPLDPQTRGPAAAARPSVSPCWATMSRTDHCRWTWRSSWKPGRRSVRLGWRRCSTNYTRTGRAQASPKYREGAEAGRRVSAPRLWRIVAEVARLRRESASLFEQVDLLLMPAAAALPWPAAQAYPPVIDGIAVGPRGHAVYTGWVNAAGLPGLALPADPSAEGSADRRAADRPL